MTQEASELIETALDHPVGEPTGDDYYGIPILEDTGHPLVPSLQHEYVSRRQRGTMTDLEVLGFIISDPDFHPLLVGEPGTGKNMALRKIAQETNRPLARVNFGADTTKEKLIGMWSPSEDPQRQFEWQDGLLTAAVRNGWMFCADELNAAPPEATMPLHGLCEGEDERFLSIEDTSEILVPHEEFIFAATMNPSHHAGTHEINDAFKSRLFHVPFGWLEEEQELAVLDQRTGIVREHGRETTLRIIKIANRIRSLYKERDVLTAVTTRDLIKIGRLSEEMPLDAALRMVILDPADPTDRDAIAEVLNTIRI